MYMMTTAKICEKNMRTGDYIMRYMMNERLPATYCYKHRLWSIIFAINVCVKKTRVEYVHMYLYIYIYTIETYRTKSTTSGHCRNGSDGTVASTVVVSSSWPFPRRPARPLGTTAQHTAHYNILHCRMIITGLLLAAAAAAAGLSFSYNNIRVRHNNIIYEHYNIL